MHGASETTDRFARWLGQPPSPAGSALDRAFRAGSRPGSISLAGGAPAPDLFPIAELEQAVVRALREDGARILQYGSAEGWQPLRELVVEQLAVRGLHVRPEEVLITNGSMQGLDLVGRVLLDPGDSIAVEAPTFMGAFNAWASHSPAYVTVPVDEDGLDVDALEEMLHSASPRPKFLYLLPTFQNPTGVTLTHERRERLVALAQVEDLVVLEDDPYGALSFDPGARNLPPVRAFPGAEDHVIYLGTFSKTIAPGLRLAYVVASPAMLERLLRAKRGTDMQTNGLVQAAVERLCRGPEFDFQTHLSVLRTAYREHRDAMLDALETTFAGDLRWTRPAGGFFVWVDLPDAVAALDLLPRALEEGVGFVPGPVFFPDGGGEHSLRLSFSNVRAPAIREGIARLGRALQRV